MKRFFAFFLAVALTISVSGCSLFRKKQAAQKGPKQIITLSYYRFGDDDDAVKPLLDQYQQAHADVQIRLVTGFPNFELFEDRVLNEMAAGGGPDIISVPNTWIYKHQSQVSPLPDKLMSVDAFRQTFVAVADRDLVRPDGATPPSLRIYGVPLYVDTLATYYNKSHYEDRVPSPGRPATMWGDFVNEVTALTKYDTGTGKFDVSGVAMGRIDNVSYGMDVLLSLLLQYGAKFYNDQNTQVAFVSQGGDTSPAVRALEFFTRFAVPGQASFAWSKDVTSSATPSPDVDAFVSRKVSTIFGYSDTYAKIQKTVSGASRSAQSIDMKDVQVALLPQLNDPSASTTQRQVLARYMAETVPRTSKYQQQAWDIILFLASQKSQTVYHTKTHRPTSRRDLLQAQSSEPIYGAFAQQVGSALSAPLYDAPRTEAALSKAVARVTDDALSTSSALKEAEDMLRIWMPQQGFLGPGPYTLVPQK